MQTRSEKSGRIPYIDGMRGLASLLVIFCHIAYVFLPGLNRASLAEDSFQLFWNGSLLNVLTNGNTAVQVFFVLSGYLICKNSNERKKLVNPIREYWKLLRIVFPAVVFTSLLMYFQLLHHCDIPRFNPEIISYNNFEPTIANVMSDAFIMTFIKTSSYVGPFWTIKYEMSGAILISVTSYLFSYLRKDLKLIVVYGITAILLFILSPNLVSFIFGALVYECLYFEKDERAPKKLVIERISRSKIMLLFLFLSGVYLACTSGDLIGIYRPLNFVPGIMNGLGVVRSFGVAVCLYCIEGHYYLLRRFFSLKLFTWLGRISAYTYAFHWPIIISLGCWLFIKLDGSLPRPAVLASITAIVIPVTLIVAFCVTKSDKQLFGKK